MPWAKMLSIEFVLGGGERIDYMSYTPGTRVGPGGRDRILAIKSKKNIRKSAFVKGNDLFFFPIIYLSTYSF